MDEKIVKPKRPKPTVSLDETDLPAIKNWQVGQKYTINAVVKMTFQSQGDEWGGEFSGEQSQKPKMRARFRILSISPTKQSKTKKAKNLPRVKEY